MRNLFSSASQESQNENKFYQLDKKLKLPKEYEKTSNKNLPRILRSTLPKEVQSIEDVFESFVDLNRLEMELFSFIKEQDKPYFTVRFFITKHPVLKCTKKISFHKLDFQNHPKNRFYLLQIGDKELFFMNPG